MSNNNTDLVITTNNHWREFLHGADLPASVRDEFDYLDDQALECNLFAKYKGEFYDVSSFITLSNDRDDTTAMASWHGAAAMSWYCGVLIRISDDNERYQVGTYLYYSSSLSKS